MEQLKQLQNNLDKLEKIRKVTQGQDLQLPQICVVGDQSSGKSSLLSSISGINFPEASGICTKAPIVVQLSKNHSLSETFSVNGIPVENIQDVTNVISKEQQFLLQKNGCKVSEEPISVKMSSPVFTPLVLVDLPGLIHNGEGIEEVEAMINAYIKQENTLILVVRTANSDDESQKAIALATRHDPNAIRTIQIYTKADIFDSEDNKQRVIQNLTDSIGQVKGAHLVCCRRKGNASEDPKEEMNFFKSHEDFRLMINQGNIGVDSLKNERLPTLLEEIVQKNIPTLTKQISEKLEEANSILDRIGEHTIDSSRILVEAHDDILETTKILYPKFSEFYSEFKSQIFTESKKVEREWIDKNYKHNSFQVIFFAGEDCFLSCLKDLSNSYIPHAFSFVDSVKDELEPVVKNSIDSSILSHKFVSLITNLWSDLVTEITQNLEQSLQTEIMDDVQQFSTDNHYLEANFKENLEIPDEIYESFEKQLEKQEHHEIEKSNSPFGGETEIVKKTINLSAAEVNNQLKKLISSHLGQYAKKPLIEQQKDRIYHAVLAYSKTSLKTLSDRILAITRRVVFDKIESFLSLLKTNSKLAACAIENEDIIGKRKRAILLKEKMIESRKILDEF